MAHPDIASGDFDKWVREGRGLSKKPPPLRSVLLHVYVFDLVTRPTFHRPPEHRWYVGATSDLKRPQRLYGELRKRKLTSPDWCGSIHTWLEQGFGVEREPRVLENCRPFTEDWVTLYSVFGNKDPADC